MATIPSPSTQTASAVVTSTLLNNHRDALQFMLGSSMTGGGGRRPLAILSQTVIQTSIASGGAITFDTETVDYDASHSTATNTSRFTAVTAGYHDIEASVSLASNTTGSFRSLEIKVTLSGGGSSSLISESNCVYAAAAVPAIIISLGASTKHYLNVGDYVEAIVTHNATALNTAVNSGNPRMAVQWVSN